MRDIIDKMVKRSKIEEYIYKECDANISEDAFDHYRMVKALEFYVDEYYSHPFFPSLQNSRRIEEFKERSYSIWAAKEILERIKKSKRSPVIILEYELDDISDIISKRPDLEMFVIRCDVACNMYDFLMSWY